MSEDVRAIARGTGLLLPATIVGSALLLLLDQYVNGVLGNADYGLFGALKRVLQVAGFVVLLGMENAVIRFVASAATSDDARAAVRRAMLLSVGAACGAAALLAALADPLAAWLDPSPDTATVLRLGALSLPFAALRTVAVSASQGWRVVTHRAIVMYLAWPVTQFAGVALLGSALGWGVLGVTAAYTGAMALGALLAVGFLARLAPGALRAGAERGPSVAAMLGFAWPMWTQGILMALYTWLDQFLLAGLRSTEEAGIYGPVATLAPLFGMGLGALNGMFAPIIAERRASGDLAGLQRLYRTVTRWAVALAVPPLVVCAVLPASVLALWPNGSPEAVPALRIACFAALVCTGVGSVNYLLIMAGHPRATLWNALPAAVLNLLLSLLLLPTWGVTGAAVANGVAMVAANGIGLWQVRAALGIHPFDRAFFRPLVAAAPCAVAVAAVGWAPGPPWVTVVGAGLVGGAVFLVALRAIGLDADDRVVVDAIVSRVRLRRGA